MASWREVGARVQFLDNHRSFATGFGFVRGLVVLAIVHGQDRGEGLDNDLRDAVLGLGDVELRAVLAVIVGGVLVGDRNFRNRLAVQQLLNPRTKAFGGGCSALQVVHC